MADTHPDSAPGRGAGPDHGETTENHVRDEGDEAPRRSLWRGRIMLIAGIVLLGISLRYAVTGLSPILPVVREGLGIGVTGASIIGMLPTLMFGAGGLLAPILARRSSTELVAVTGMTLATVGALARALSNDATLFIVLSAVSLLGMGFGNVVGAPLVKKYFPDRQAVMLTAFALLMQAGATLPAFTAVPIANAAGWRASLASWALISFLAILPWAVQLFKNSRTADGATQENTSQEKGPDDVSFGIGSLLRSPTAVGTALFYAIASFNTYAVLAWMPTLLGDRGLDLGAAAGVFSIYTFMTLPMALIVPLIAAKMKQPFPLAAALSVVHAIGFIGLLVIPGIPAVWVTIMGLGGGAFPFAIAMFNRRTRTEGGSAALSGFAMGVGYLVGTLGPLAGGWLLSATGGWEAAMVLYAASGVVMLVGAYLMTRDKHLEDEVGAGSEAATAEPHE